MGYAFTWDLPVSMAVYRLVRLDLGRTPPRGLIVQVVIPYAQGIRITDVWDHRLHWVEFRDRVLAPTLARVLPSIGLPDGVHEPPIHELADIEVWRGTA